MFLVFERVLIYWCEPHLLMVEVEYDRVARVCNNVFLKKINGFIVFGYSKNL